MKFEDILQKGPISNKFINKTLIVTWEIFFYFWRKWIFFGRKIRPFGGWCFLTYFEPTRCGYFPYLCIFRGPKIDRFSKPNYWGYIFTFLRRNPDGALIFGVEISCKKTRKKNWHLTRDTWWAIYGPPRPRESSCRIFQF